jgi:hypothetical protein
MYRTATFSGSVERSGKVARMSVKTLDSGWELMLRAGFRSEETLGYAGPTSLGVETPSDACCCRSWRKSRRRESNGQVGGPFRIGAACPVISPLGVPEL